MNRHIFTRAEIADYVRRVYTSEYAPDETVTIEQIVRIKGATPALWIVDYTRRYNDTFSRSYHSKAIVMAGRDFHGNAELCLPETIILPEEVPQEEEENHEQAI